MNNSNAKIGKFKFDDLRPKHVCLRTETPANICLCIYHKNIKLILQSIPDLPNSTAEFERKKLSATMKMKDAYFKRVVVHAEICKCTMIW